VSSFLYIKTMVFFVAAFLELFLVFVFWSRGKSRETFHLGLLSFFTAILCLSFGMNALFLGRSMWWQKFTWIGIFIIPSAVSFVYVFVKRTKHFVLKASFWNLSDLAIVCLIFFMPYFTEEDSYFQTGFLDLIGQIYIVAGGGLCFFYLLREYFKGSGLRKWQVKYFILGAGIAFSGFIFVVGIIPIFYPGFDHRDFSVVFIFPGVFMMTYAILKEKLFEIRILLIEILIIAMNLFLLIQVFLLKETISKIISLFVFISFLLIGYLLVKTTQKEIQKKEEAEELAEKLRKLRGVLESKVQERSLELKRALKETEERKNELEKFYTLVAERKNKLAELKKQFKRLKSKTQ